MTDNLRIEFKLVLDEKEVALDTFLTDPKKLLDFYLKKDRLTCCSFQGGFCIEINGVPWNGYTDPVTKEVKYRGEIDEFWMTASLIRAPNELLSGSTIAHFWPWEQANCNLILENNNDLYIENDNGNEKSDRVSLEEFSIQVLAKAKEFVELSQKIKKEADLLEKENIDLNLKIKEINTNFSSGGFQEETEKLEMLIKKFTNST